MATISRNAAAFAVTAGMRGGWTAEDHFRSEHDGIAMIDAFDLLLEFAGDRLLMSTKRRFCEEGITLEGHAD